MSNGTEGTVIDDRPRISVSCELKLNMGNYESAGGSCVLSGLHEDVTGAEIDALLDTAEMAFNLIRERIQERLNEVRAEKAATR